MLRLERISVAYGKHEALHDVSIDVPDGRTTVILGANGAGKTTLLKTIAGLVHAQPGGRILLDGRPIQNEPTHQIVAAGIALVPEGRRLFGEMTVIDNLRMGAYTEHARPNAAAQLEKQLATFPRLAERRSQLAKTMSGGEQQMLAIARALMSEPKILLLDEPSLGLAPRLIKELFAALRTITEGGQSVVLVEQNAHQSLQLADHVYVLENGRVHSSGTPEEIRQDTVIQQAYLGLKSGQAAPAAAKAAATQIPAGQLTASYQPSGGFVNPFARNVGTARDEERREPERHVTIALERGQAMGGFYNPYARSVSPEFAPRKPEAASSGAETQPAAAHHPDRPDATGGFTNPYSRSPGRS